MNESSKAKPPSKLKGRDPAEVKPGKIKGLVFGPGGSGKTFFGLSFPVPFYIDTEGGADLAHYQARLAASKGRYFGPEDGALDFPTVMEQVQALATETHPYRTLVVGSITKIYQTCIANEAERLGDKDAFGASKKPAIAQMRRLVNWINRLDMNVWFEAHETSEWGVNAKSGQREEIGKQPDVWDKLIYELDLALWFSKRGNSRVATVRKSRLTGFPDGDTFMLQENGKDVAYENFAARYGRDCIEAPVQPIKLATMLQVSEIIRLLDTVKVSEAEVEKVLTKAGAENWHELNETQAEATIAWLQKKVTGK